MNLLLINAKLHNRTDCDAILCENGRIRAIGSSAQLLSMADADTKTVDLNGRLLLPGFDDSHMHLLDTGHTMSKLDLRSARSTEDVVAMGKEFFASHDFSGGRWLEACNWNDNDWEDKRIPTRADLDRISTEVPIVAQRICGHVVVVNSAGLRMIGVDAGTAQPTDGSYFDLDENGEPNGVLHEMYYRVSACIPPYRIEDIMEKIMLAARLAASKGLTCIQSDDLEVIPVSDTEDVIEAFRRLSESGELPVRVVEQCYLPNVEKLRRFFDHGFHSGWGSELFTLGPVKLIADGSLGSRTALMLDDYSDEAGTRGLQIYKDEQEYYDIVDLAYEHDIPVAVHCIGDAASAQTIRAIENARRCHEGKVLRDGIVHAQILNSELVRKMSEMQLLAFIQPVFIQSDMDMAEDRIGHERLMSSYNWRTLADAGVPCSMGSDCPVEDNDPIANIYTAVTRRSIAHPERPVWYPEECLTVEEAVCFYTEGSAYAAGQEDFRGKLEVGYAADFTVLTRDIYNIAPEEILGCEVYMTVCAGRITYEKNG